jgi:hypothetical protein
LAIYNTKSINNIILEADAELSTDLPDPPEKSCYLGGWIIPLKVSLAGKVIPDIETQEGLNDIDFDKFKILMTHAYFIKTPAEAMEVFQTTIKNKIKNYDIHLNQYQVIKSFIYPPVFVQTEHISEIDKKSNQNHKHSFHYGLKI